MESHCLFFGCVAPSPVFGALELFERVERGVGCLLDVAFRIQDVDGETGNLTGHAGSFCDKCDTGSLVGRVKLVLEFIRKSSWAADSTFSRVADSRNYRADL